MTADVSVADHFRATGAADCPPGVYRVVGVDDGSVALLQVADGSGRRVHTGLLVHRSTDALAATFDPADPPGRGLVGTLANLATGLWWSLVRG